MGKNKLRKFAEVEANPLVLQYPFGRLSTEQFPLRGRWGADFFHNDNPIVLELGCGKGEYTVGLGRHFADRNFIGIDIKGARIWSGATQALRDGMTNVAFLRTSIELLEHFFAPGEVSEIWITFPDPQMRKASKRLTGTRMMAMYGRLLAEGGKVHLKSDSPFLYEYTSLMARHNGLTVEQCCDDIYGTYGTGTPLTDIRTHYEQQWLDRGLTIKYIRLVPGTTSLEEPPGAEDIPLDTYRSYSRGYIQMPDQMPEINNE
ncbi:MAG: tRNA (guanosine(46)-N7)-methyltransferase TrmB [Muribaculaceae bacterium]|nr:tRNA (guanosine(46)-N7)-methyltransferase TrmB [Muribaculaceae bacterium]